VPAGLGSLNASLQSLADFLRIDPELIAAGAEASAAGRPSPSSDALKDWIARLSPAEKDDWLFRFANGEEPHLRMELLKRYDADTGLPQAAAPSGRAVGELLRAAEARTRARQEREAHKAAEERAQRQREAAVRREAELQALARSEPQVWKEVATLVATKAPSKYDAAVALLKDLRELAEREKRLDGFEQRIAAIRAEHQKKPSLMERLRKAGM
jgi:hypothetical protein